MKKVLLGVGSLLVLGVCFVAAKTLVHPFVQSGVGWYELPPETRDTLLTEAAESGVNPVAMAKVADDLEQSLNSRETLAALKVSPHVLEPAKPASRRPPPAAGPASRGCSAGSPR